LKVVPLSGHSSGGGTLLEHFKNPLIETLLTCGIAIFHDGESCYLIADHSVEIANILSSLSEPEYNFLTTRVLTNRIIAPVSQEQFRTLYHSEVMGQFAWNVEHIYKVRRVDLDQALLDQAMALLVNNHDTLRTRFFASGDSWVQLIDLSAQVSVQTMDMATLTDFQIFVAQRRHCRQELDELPLVKVWLSHIQGVYYLGFVTHHSLADAFTTTLLFNELMDYYEALLRSQEVGVHRIGEQYWQYALQQFDASVYQNARVKLYWSNVLSETANVPLTVLINVMRQVRLIYSQRQSLFY